MSLSLILISLLHQTQALPRPNLPLGSSWKHRVEIVTRWDGDNLEERLIFAETITLKGCSPGWILESRRTPLESFMAGQKLPVPDKPSPIVRTETWNERTWPTAKPEPLDTYSDRLERALHYVPLEFSKVPGNEEKRVPNATYRAWLEKGEVHTLFKESTGMTATGLWKFDENGRMTSATIRCDHAFAFGGDGSPCTVTVKISPLG
jgi:hypothetical protein